MRKLLIYSFSIVAMCLIIGSLPSSTYAQQSQPKFYSAVVEKTQAREKKIQGAVRSTTAVTVRITDGTLKGRSYTVDLDTSQASTERAYQSGDEVLVSYAKDNQGTESLFIVDYIRSKQLLLLFGIFLAFVLVTARGKGLMSFIGMLFSFLIIGRMIIPNIVLGNDPIFISLLGALIITPVTFYLSHGFHKKTTIAIVGTFLALVLTGVLAYVFIELARFTGLADEQAAFLQAMKGTTINIKNLLLAGIIIGTLGVLDDITISQTSIVATLRRANPKYSFRELYFHAMSVGRDHIASLVNTLVLVYTGAALPLFLLFYDSQMSYLQVINQELIAVEIVRTLVASIGIVAAVPVTTFLACAFDK